MSGWFTPVLWWHCLWHFLTNHRRICWVIQPSTLNKDRCILLHLVGIHNHSIIAMPGIQPEMTNKKWPIGNVHVYWNSAKPLRDVYNYTYDIYIYIQLYILVWCIYIYLFVNLFIQNSPYLCIYLDDILFYWTNYLLISHDLFVETRNKTHFVSLTVPILS